MPGIVGQHIPHCIVGIGECRAVGVGRTRQAVQGIVGVLYRHLGLPCTARQGDCICVTRSSAAWHGAGILHPAPEGYAIIIGAETVLAHRQSKDHLPGIIRSPAVAAVGIAIKGIYVQTGVRIGLFSRHRDGDRLAYCHTGCFTARQGAVGIYPSLLFTTIIQL